MRNGIAQRISIGVVLFSAIASGALAQSGTVNLVDPYSDTIVVQAGNTFHVTAEHSAKSDKKLVVDLGDGRTGLTADIGELIPVKYDVPGNYTITSKLGNRKLGPVTVEVLGNAVPADVPRTVALSETAQTTSTSVGVGVGSVYAEDGYFPMRFAASGPCYFQLKRYGYGMVWSGNIPAGDTIIVMDGPGDGESNWTLIKFIDGQQKGGTHVLSPNSPYRLQIADIELEEGPSYAPVGSYVANTDWLLGTCHEATLQVVPDPWWAIDPVCGFLYEWSGTDLADSTGIEKEVDYDDGGVKEVYLNCESDDSGGESTTINSLKIDLDGQEPDADGNLVDVDDGIEADAGVLVVSQTTKLIVRNLGPGVVIGSYRLRWDNPSGNKELQLKRLGPGGGGWQDPDIEESYTGSDHTYLVKLKTTGGAVWQDTDTVEVTLSHQGYNVTCEDKVKLVPVKVDLDVDADYDGTISVDSPDDPIEVSVGGATAVGHRERIILRQPLPSAVSSLTLTWDSNKIKVFDDVEDGTEIQSGEEFSSDWPVPLWVQGESESDSARDVTLTLVAAGGAEDKISLTVYDPNVNWTSDAGDSDEMAVGPDSLTEPPTPGPGEPGGAGGFGGPPEGSGFGSLANPFTVADLVVTDTVDTDPGVMTLVLRSNVSDWDAAYQLQETSAGSRTFVDDGDTLAVRVLSTGSDSQGGVSYLAAQVVSMAFGARRTMLLHRASETPDTYESERLRIVLQMQQMPDPSIVDQLSVVLQSSIKEGSDTGTLMETAPDSMVFTNPGSTLAVTLARVTEHGDTAVDDMTVRVSSDLLGTMGTVDAIETTPASLEFRTDAISDGDATPGDSEGASTFIVYGQCWWPEYRVPFVDGTAEWPFGDEKRAAIRRKRGDDTVPTQTGDVIPKGIELNGNPFIWRKDYYMDDGDDRIWNLFWSSGEPAIFALRIDNPITPGDAFSVAGDFPLVDTRVFGGDKLIASPEGLPTPEDVRTVLSVESVVPHESDAETHKTEAASTLAKHEDHFVCVKGTGSIILDATLVPDTAEAAAAISWEAEDEEGSPVTITPDSSDNTIATLSSASAGKTIVQIKVGDHVCWEGVVWVVWASCTSAEEIPMSVRPATVETGDGTKGIGHVVKAGYKFRFTIDPASIVDGSAGADVPALKGDNESDPPYGADSHIIYGTPLSGGASKKWDVSRQLRIKTLNPHLYTPDELPDVVGWLYDNQPVAEEVATDYPPDDEPAWGNDDSGTSDEDNIPYYLPPAELSSEDVPAQPMRDSTGDLNDTFEDRSQYREFVRLELGSVQQGLNWYRASDYKLWRVHFKYKKEAFAKVLTGANGIRETPVGGDDDLALMDMFCGLSNQVAIVIIPGEGQDSIRGGDDGFLDQAGAGLAIHTGANGICESVVLGNDIPIIILGQGRPDTVGVLSKDGPLDVQMEVGDDSIAEGWVNNGSEMALDNEGF